MAERQQLLDFDLGTQRPPARLLSPDEIYVLADQDLLSEIDEKDIYERKPPGMHADPLAEWICMWANTAPHGGLIAYGVADDGRFKGCLSINEAGINRIEKAGKDYCADARYEYKRIRIVNECGQEDFIILFRVYYRNDKVVEDHSGEAFIRRGDSKYRLSDAEKRELAIDKGQVSLELEPCTSLIFPDDFDMVAIGEFTANVKTMKKLRTDYTAEQVLRNRHLGQYQGQQFIPNIACALLFAKDPLLVIHGCAIRFQRYEGTERLTGAKRNVVRDETFEGRIPDIIKMADAAIQTQIRTFSRLGDDGKFSTAPEYPRAAWYEAVVNACVHRSYNLKNMNVFVRMFDDRLVIESPGSFPPMVTPDTIYDIHHRRNYFLMDSMIYLGLVKGENEGTRRMRDEMLSLKLPPPEFRQEREQVGHALVRVTLRNNANQRRAWMDKDAAQLIGEALFSQLNEEEKRCVNYTAEFERIKAADAQRITNVKTWQTAKKLLDGLVDKGILQYHTRFHRDTKSYYTLKLPAAKPNPAPK
jgi:ATP-dependent DNA helicase RecG